MTLTSSRRQLLRATALVPLAAACTSTPHEKAVIDPDVAIREAAIARERELLAAYDAAAGATPARAAAYAAVRADHEAHLAALSAPSTGPSPASSPVGLVAHERAAAAAHAADALRASRPLAALLASLGACEASHVVALA